jgi:hypothetical protein
MMERALDWDAQLLSFNRGFTICDILHLARHLLGDLRLGFHLFIP